MEQSDHSEHVVPIDPVTGRWMKQIHPVFIRPPLLSRCERIPFLMLLAAVVFITVVLFGITPLGLLCGLGLFLLGRAKLRQVAEYDPYFFAMWWESRQFPKHMPEVVVDPLVGDCAFIGYDDPPTWRQVLWAWSVVIGIGLASLAALSLVAMVGWLFFFA